MIKIKDILNVKFILKDIFKYSNVKYNIWVILYSITILISSFIIGQSTKLIFNSIQENKWEYFLNYIILAFISLIIIMIISYFARFYTYKASELVGEKLYQKLFAHITKLSMTYFDNHSTGDLQSIITYDVQKAIKIYRLDISYILGLVFNGFGSAILIFTINYKIGLIALGLGIVGYLVNILFLKPIQNVSKKISSQYGDLTDTFTQIIKGNSTIRIFSLYKWMNEKFNVFNNKIKNNGIKLNKIGTLQSFINSIISNINTFLFLIISLLFLSKGNLMFGDVMAAFYYSQAVVLLFINLSNAFVNMQNSYASIIRIEEIQTIDKEKNSSLINTLKVNSSPVIEFKNVTFSYNSNKKVIEDVSFKINRGDIIHIKGHSGIGKSTIFKLLLGLYPLDDGSINVFGVKIEDISFDNLRNAFSYISQDPVLIDGTILENINIVNEKLELCDVIAAAKKANIHNFINSLPQKYNTSIGEGGKLLSGGQRQRIAMARAILKDAPILLFDEPLSALDNLNAENFYSVFDNCLRQKTILIISHRMDDNSLITRFKDKFKTIAL